ncbi:MAG TPA: GNAT family N-acetyltransferase [Pirellulales bacterium]|nr:GNAT family N-acetyltransferase [Pirellulales bacterium]
MATDCAAHVELDVRLLRGEREFDDIVDVWNGLARGMPFRRHEWLATWWRHFRRPGDELFVPVVHDADGQIMGLAPWYVARDRVLGRVVRFLGSGKVCSEHLTMLAADELEDGVARRLAHWLAHEAAPRWDLLDFDGVDGEDPALASLIEELSTAGHPVFQRTRGRTWQAQLAPTWDEFLAGLSKGRRAKLRAHQRRLIDGNGVSVLTADEATLARGLDAFHRLHMARRSSLGDDSCLGLPNFAPFLNEAAALFQKLGRLRLQWIEIEGEPAAIEFDLLGDDTLYYYQTGMNPDLAEISPGWLLQVASVQRAIDEGFLCFDFLRGDEAYKASWGAEPRPLVQFRVAARRPLPRLRHSLWLFARGVKNRLCGKTDC